MNYLMTYQPSLMYFSGFSSVFHDIYMYVYTVFSCVALAMRFFNKNYYSMHFHFLLVFAFGR